MSSPSLRALAKDTAIYGVSSILGRVIGFLLVPLYSGVFAPEDFGIQALLYSYISFIVIFYVMRLDIAFFRFSEDGGRRVFDTAFSAIAIVGAVVSILIHLNATWLSTSVFNFSEAYVPHVQLMAMILFMDALAEIPFAKLRYEKRPLRFASIRITGICVNIGMNLLFLLGIPYLTDAGYMELPIRMQSIDLVQYIFFANVISSGVVLLLLSPEWTAARMRIDRDIIRQMLIYAAPLIIVSLASNVNELADRFFLDRLLPYDDAGNKHAMGIYTAVYKFSIIIALFTQSYRYAAEPFFFAHAKNKKSPALYARMAKYFVIFTCFGMLCILLYMPYYQSLILRKPEYLQGLPVVPILIAAQICLGIYYNLSVWYKLSDKTVYAMYIALAGAAITIAINVLLIPTYGYWASAWATLICYLTMTVLSYVIGKRHYELHHELLQFFAWIAGSLALYYGLTYLSDEMGLGAITQFALFTAVLIAIAGLIYRQLLRERTSTAYG